MVPQWGQGVRHTGPPSLRAALPTALAGPREAQPEVGEEPGHHVRHEVRDHHGEEGDVRVEAVLDEELAAVGLQRGRMVLGWPRRCKLAHAFRWEYS